MEMFNQGFTTKSAKKDAIALITREFETVTDTTKGIRGQLLDMRSEGTITHEECDIMYWGFPTLNNWKEKHSNMFKTLFPNEVAYIESLVEMRETFKDAEIITVKRESTIDIKRKQIELTIKEEIEKSNKMFISGLKMVEIFGNMNVSVNAHYVVNQFGHKFVRCFYYLNGRIMALNTIIAIAEEIENKGK